MEWIKSKLYYLWLGFVIIIRAVFPGILSSLIRFLFPKDHAGYDRWETIKEGRIVISKLIDCYPDLGNVLAETDIISDDSSTAYKLSACSYCPGTLHPVGRNKLPNSRLGMGLRFVCDQCGRWISIR